MRLSYLSFTCFFISGPGERWYRYTAVVKQHIGRNFAKYAVYGDPIINRTDYKRLTFAIHPFVIFLIITAGNFFYPFLIIQIPFNCFHNAHLEFCFGIPSQGIGDFRRIDSIALVMTQTVLYKRNQVFIDPVNRDFTIGILFLSSSILHDIRDVPTSGGESSQWSTSLSQDLFFRYVHPHCTLHLPVLHELPNR